MFGGPVRPQTCVPDETAHRCVVVIKCGIEDFDRDGQPPGFAAR